ncbi:hypothetical protein WMY93_002462 [Mugilogobius chulae]|uniref:Sema domain-containing protein n=1 Tax=Mugilogobius chulae TaxID=88201 RepID=A0AAW0PZR1_9GOBI
MREKQRGVRQREEGEKGGGERRQEGGNKREAERRGREEGEDEREGDEGREREEREKQRGDRSEGELERRNEREEGEEEVGPHSSVWVHLVLGSDVLSGVSHLSVFLLDPDSGRLYVGGRDALLQLDTTRPKQAPRKIVWDVPAEKKRSCLGKGKTEADCHNYIRLLEFLGDGRIYVCGTFAFDPQCAFVELSSFSLQRAPSGAVVMETGKYKCPFEPGQHYTAVMAGGILYSAATSNFLGTQFDISRVTGPEEKRIRMEQSTNWLSDPEFVSSAFIQQSPNNNPQGDDDKIYFFFTELAKEYELYTKVKVPRVARVCKSDVGGMKTLQRRWTTFLKAQLVCEDKPSGQRYNVLTDVFSAEHRPGDPGSTHFYVLDGPFKDLKKCETNWPRSGAAILSLSLSPSLFLFFSLPLPLFIPFLSPSPLSSIFSLIFPPLYLLSSRLLSFPCCLLLSLGPASRSCLSLSCLSFCRTSLLSLCPFCLAALLLSRELHRVAVVAHNATLLQEKALFSPAEPINNILLHQGRVLVGSPSSVALIPDQDCGLYSSCEECARARGLGCEWRESVCATSRTCEPDSGDIIDAALRKCHPQHGRCSPAPTDVPVVLGLRVLLPCVQLSPRPCSWVHPPDRLTRQHHSHLEVTVSEGNLGTYTCTCQEAGPGVSEPTLCRRAEYHLTLGGPVAGQSSSLTGTRHVLALYILVFVVGVACGVLVWFFVGRRAGAARCAGPQQESSLSEKGQRSELLGSSTTPQSPISTSFSDMTDKRNGTAPSTTSTTLHSHHGNGTHHITNGNGSGLYGNLRHRLSSDVMDSSQRETPEGERAGRRAAQGPFIRPAVGPAHRPAHGSAPGRPGHGPGYSHV